MRIETQAGYLNRGDSEQSFRSLALYGLGGAGNSSIALQYAVAKVEQAEFDAVFWVYSETPSSIRQSFSDITLRLQLPSVNPRDHDQHRTLVLDWLQHTRKLTI
jgi:hypothetical protein